ncbi:MAG: Wzz/FepE/Etk N-terminal domain-containing protein [Chromatiales bacterium]|jgi:uncharacterized protein involved in exopolysaccharide biosynthesis|nr:Wzz/FepE/Etk N-terminal domain-containing protein [Chromatiales bacterium]MDX9768259.1 Wzz/FepE/Etk N-terminal domain-containing protein [Ectothiorhodospiraceae bacterium]
MVSGEQLPPAGPAGAGQSVSVSGQTPVYATYPPYGLPPEDEIDLLDLWEVLSAYKWLIALVLLVGIAGGVFYAQTATPMYSADVTLTAADEGDAAAGLRAQLGGLAAMAGVSLPSGDKGNLTQRALATLKSRTLIEAFITEKDLMPVLYAERWDAEAKTWRDDGAPPPTLWRAVRGFQTGILSVKPNNKNGVTSVAIEWRDPEQAAEWANELVRRVNRQLRDEALAETDRNLAYLEQQLNRTTLLDVQRAISSLIEGQIKTRVLTQSRQEYAFRIIDPAVPPEQPIKPRKAQIVAVSGMVALLIGIMFAFFLNFLGNARRRLRERRAQAGGA